MGMTFSSKDFNEKFDKITKEKIPGNLEKGLGRAALQLLNDCVMQSPTVPIKEGWLRGSGSVFVNNKLISTSPFGKTGKANLSYAEPLRKKMMAVVGFNTPYAARLHESVGYTFSEPSAGPQYMAKKIRQNSQIYIMIISEELKKP